MESEFEIAYEASDAVRAVLGQLQRIEDVKFSPSGHRLLLTGYDRDSIAFADVRVVLEGQRPLVTVTDVVEVASPRLQHPHGAAFLDDETVVVASRRGTVTLLRLPPEGANARTGELTPIDLPPGGGFELLDSPSAVTITGSVDGDVELLVCNNDGNTVTRHVLHRESSDGYVVTLNEVLVQRRLALPDGIAVSPDGAWIAVSNHDYHRVMLYERTPSLSEGSDPRGMLRGAWCPHGIRFSDDGVALFVADAESPHVNVYTRNEDTWAGVQFHPADSVRVMDDDLFARGHRLGEGGPKGLDLDPSGRVLVVTCESRPLLFFDAAAIVEAARGRLPDGARELSDELAVLEQERFAEVRAEATFEARIAALEASTSYRVTKPLRHLKTAWSKMRDRGRPARGG